MFQEKDLKVVWENKDVLIIVVENFLYNEGLLAYRVYLQIKVG